MLGYPGFGQLVVNGHFDEVTEDAVSYFQMTHVDENGEPLDVDGQVGPNTWWALYNPSGELQRNHYEGVIPGASAVAARRYCVSRSMSTPWECTRSRTARTGAAAS